MVGKIVCTPEEGRNRAMPPQLLSHFIVEGRKKRTMGVLHESIWELFGWPLAVSYTIRNQWVHAGGLTKADGFFDGPTSSAGFRISANVWAQIIQDAGNDYKVQPRHCRGGFPSLPADDARVVWMFCIGEMDEALGILLGSACKTLEMHVSFLAGLD